MNHRHDNTDLLDTAAPANADSRERRVSSAVFQWATGVAPASAGRVVLCATDDEVSGLLAHDGLADTFLVPSSSDAAAPPDRVLTFEGRFDEPGDVMHIGRGYEIELQDYLAVPFVPVTRPTVVSCLTSSAWSAFIEDAEEAFATGSFIPQLASHSVVIADRSVIDAAIDGTSVAINRLSIDAHGDVRYRLGGPVVGAAGSTDLGDQPASTFLVGEEDAAEAGESVAAEFAARPWIRRYLTALRIVGGTDGESWSISGFGGALTGAETDRGLRRRSGHLIIWRDDEYQLVAETGRRFALGRETAIAVEALLEAPSFEQAVSTARSAGLDRHTVPQELRELRERFAAVGVIFDSAEDETSS
ncbi:daptide biosynthesis RiPP recognition protein [Microbacterium sp. 179-I 3D3 NHS]|uniref:daptide biosynthesis RiPP recognition protein n=1 Tax=Microbacterium sp. 179-I 3D3 NHS TaxID=3142382 RepID=UPI0039A10F55